VNAVRATQRGESNLLQLKTWEFLGSEKQTPQVVEKIKKPKEQIEGVESSIVLRRQMPY
jgi:hypothetical protein